MSDGGYCADGTEREGNPAFMSGEERRKEWGEVCSFCGYREAHHPIEYADPDKDGYLCEKAGGERSDE